MKKLTPVTVKYKCGHQYRELWFKNSKRELAECAKANCERCKEGK